MIPGDDFKPDPIIQRGEALERLGKAITSEQLRTLGQIKEYARLRSVLREVADDPRTLFTDEARRPLIHGTDDPSTPEDESDYLGAQNSRDARAREAWLRKAWASLWHALGPLVLQFGQAAIGAALAKVPHDVLIPGLVKLDLTPVVAAVEAAAMDAAGQVVKDVTG